MKPPNSPKPFVQPISALLRVFRGKSLCLVLFIKHSLSLYDRWEIGIEIEYNELDNIAWFNK